MRELVKEFVKICSEVLPVSEPIYEFGSFRVPEQEELANLRPLFPGKKYVGADMRQGPGVDVILDLHHIDLPSESVGTALTLETLEHVEFPREALEQISKILNKNGIVIISSIMNFPIHEYPDDYWRFTPSAFKSMSKSFSYVYVESVGEDNFPHTIVGVGIKGEPPSSNILDEFQNRMRQWKKYWSSSIGMGRLEGGWIRVMKMPLGNIRLTVHKKSNRFLELSTREISHS
ncbi:MAG: methyltransferase domain-containing protein [bacterium]